MKLETQFQLEKIQRQLDVTDDPETLRLAAKSFLQLLKQSQDLIDRYAETTKDLLKTIR